MNQNQLIQMTRTLNNMRLRIIPYCQMTRTESVQSPVRRFKVPSGKHGKTKNHSKLEVSK
jgi:hypothetical protein